MLLTIVPISASKMCLNASLRFLKLNGLW
uniref:Uncharacterized protein n=1 Tax=Rhizophora mucronata TaxID=61149 RepID=A0A2P2Q9N3_RHIMU